MNFQFKIDKYVAAIQTTFPAKWFARLRAENVSEETSQEFREWLRSDENNELNYELYEMIWSLSGDPALEKDPEILRHLAEVDQLVDNYRHRRRLRDRLRYPVMIAAAVGVFAVALSLILSALPTTYNAGVGEQRTVVLEDGSQIMLNIETRVAVKYNENRRYIELRHGESLFDVADDSQRPFDVVAQGIAVRATGTQFNIALMGDEVEVTVLEGRVEVRFDAAMVGRAADHELVAGEQVRYRDGRLASRIKLADASRATAWSRGEVDFENARLVDAIEEVNRYATTEIILGDIALVDLRVSGVFRAGDSKSFLSALENIFDVEVVERDGLIVVLERKNRDAL